MMPYIFSFIRWIIALVVAVTVVADNIEGKVLAELLIIFHCNPCRLDHRFRIVAIDVEDRRLNHIGNV